MGVPICPLLLSFNLSLNATNDIIREQQLRLTSEADGVKFIGEVRIPFAVPNSDLKCYGWHYHPELDSAIIQYSINGNIEGTIIKETLARKTLNLWNNGETGKNLRAMGFRDMAVMITYKKGLISLETEIYSSISQRWHTFDEYIRIEPNCD